MSKPAPMAGGFFLVAPIVIGFIWGIANYRAMQGAMIGLGVGLLLLLVTWLVDRRRGQR